MGNIGKHIRTVPDEEPLRRAPAFTPPQREVPDWLTVTPEPERVLVPAGPQREKQAARQ